MISVFSSLGNDAVTKCGCIPTLITTAHSFPRKILPNSAGQFAKFRGSPWQNCPNSTAYRSLPFVRKLSFILLKTSVSGGWHGTRI